MYNKNNLLFLKNYDKINEYRLKMFYFINIILSKSTLYIYNVNTFWNFKINE